MDKKTKEIIMNLTFLFLIYLALMPRYHVFLPTLPIYDNEEVKEVKKLVKKRNSEHLDYFKLTDESVIHAFKPHVKESKGELYSIINSVVPEILFFKYIINRPRPYQIDKELKYINSDTGHTPSMPAGHAYQAYYLSKELSKKYPDKRELFEGIAKKCDDCRVYAGIHYPKDGKYAKCILDMFH
jgi:hypothetical protein